MPGLLLPLALAALAAVILPLVIHLARRDEQKPTLFAALRWLRQKPKPQQRLRFDEWPLLLTRLILLALLALFLARPVLFDGGNSSPYAAVVPGADVAQVKASADGKARLHWLAPGFPALDETPPKTAVQVASLLRQLDAELPKRTKLTVFVPAQFAGADAERPRLSRAVDWRVVGGSVAAQPVKPAPAPKLSVRYGPGQAGSVRYLRAAATAWAAADTQPDFDAAPLTAGLPADDRVLVWLAPGALPSVVRERVARGGAVLMGAATTTDWPAQKTVEWRDETGVALAEAAPLGRGRLLRLTRPLIPDVLPQLFDSDFPDHLRRVLAGPPPSPSRVNSADYAPMTGAGGYVPPAFDLQPWLSVLIALLVVAERWLATSRRRGGQP